MLKIIINSRRIFPATWIVCRLSTKTSTFGRCVRHQTRGTCGSFQYLFSSQAEDCSWVNGGCFFRPHRGSWKSVRKQITGWIWVFIYPFPLVRLITSSFVSWTLKCADYHHHHHRHPWLAYLLQPVLFAFACALIHESDTNFLSHVPVLRVFLVPEQKTAHIMGGSQFLVPNA